MNTRVDVVIIGAGLAGLTLARQLLMQKELTILHLEKRPSVPVQRQKVGESNVQIQGWYLGKVLDLEEYLFHEHLMKYNLRFLWKTPGGDADDFFSYSQSYIRKFSNIPCYQLDRNTFEGELIRRNREHQNYTLLEGVRNLDVSLSKGEEDHVLSFAVDDGQFEINANWVVDTSGRSRVLARQENKRRPAEIPHSAVYFWVDGTVNIEKLTPADTGARIRNKSRRALGHLPCWLATNHFMGDGFWFWVIPLQGRTSFGLVYDHNKIDPAQVRSKPGLMSWLKQNFPLFEDAFDEHDLIDFSIIKNYAHDCERTLHKNRWAMSGEAGRFTDPLYSPGGDLIAVHNTLITDAILTEDPTKRDGKISMYETMCKIFYQSFIPSYEPGYGGLGDQEVFAMKYAWELSIYFGMFTFPFINNLLVERNFLVPYFRRLAALGNMNKKIQNGLEHYYRWKQHETAPEEPVFFDFTEFETLQKAEKTFYEMGLTNREAIKVLDGQLDNLRELARYIVAHVETTITARPDLMHNTNYINDIDLEDTGIRTELPSYEADHTHTWAINAGLLQTRFPKPEPQPA